MVKSTEKAAWITLHNIKLPEQDLEQLRKSNSQFICPILCIETHLNNECSEIEVPVANSKGIAEIEHDLCVVFDEVALQYPNAKKLRVAIMFVVKLKPGDQEIGTLQLKMDAVKPLGLDQGQQELQLGNSDARLSLTLQLVEVEEVPLTVQRLGAQESLLAKNKQNGIQKRDSRASSSYFEEEILIGAHLNNIKNQENGMKIAEDEDETDSVILLDGPINQEHHERPASASPLYGNIERWIEVGETHRRSLSHMVRYTAPNFEDTFMNFNDATIQELPPSPFQDKATQTDHELLLHYISQLANEGQLQIETVESIPGEQRVIPIFFVVGSQPKQKEPQILPFGSNLLETEVRALDAAEKLKRNEVSFKEQICSDLDDDDGVFANLVRDISERYKKHHRAMSDIGNQRLQQGSEDFFQDDRSAPPTFPVDFPHARRQRAQYAGYAHSQQEDIRSYNNYTPDVEDFVWHRKNLRKVNKQVHMYGIVDNDDEDEEVRNSFDPRCFTPASDFYPERVSSALSNSILPSYYEAPPVLQTLVGSTLGIIPDVESRPESRVSDSDRKSRLSNGELDLRSRLTPVNTSRNDLFRELTTSTPNLRRVTISKTPRKKKEPEQIPEWVALARAKQQKIQSFSKASQDIQVAISAAFKNHTPTCMTPTNISMSVDEKPPLPRRTPIRSTSTFKGDGQGSGPSWRRGNKLGRSSTMAATRYIRPNETPEVPEWQRLLRERRKKLQDGSNLSESSMLSGGRQDSALSGGSNGVVLQSSSSMARPITPDFRKNLKRTETKDPARELKNAPHLSGKVKDLKKFFDLSHRQQEEESTAQQEVAAN